jgi:hypothetical protein
MKEVKCKTFKSTVTVGLFKGYTKELISLEFVKKSISNIQKTVYEQFDIVLSAKVTICEIICLGQEEPSVSIEFIQYPKFLYEEKTLKEAILFFTKKMQESLHQNRVVVVFRDETIMLENNNEIDPTIKIKDYENTYRRNS